MTIHANFPGGNIKVVKEDGNEIYLENEMRDSADDWFYWAFCVEKACGRTLTFHFCENRLGYFGPAVSGDFSHWSWLGACGENSFTYTFGEKEDRMYFAHHMIYDTGRFYDMAKQYGIEIKELCKSGKGRSVPYIEFGSGRTVILTSRHHACESTGDYVLEGAIRQLLATGNRDYRYVVVPFADFDGVTEGDQGKGRVPHDHNRDYTDNPIYAETAAIIKIVNSSDLAFGCDFHSPWHRGGINDKCFIVCNDVEHIPEYKAFGDIFESKITPEAFRYRCSDNFPFGVDWNCSDAGQCAAYVNKHGPKVAFSLETAYFGTEDNIFTQERGLNLGKCFAEAMMEYLKL